MAKVNSKKVIDIAIGEIGYIEKASNSQLDNKTANAGSNNYTKYARDLHDAGYYQAPKNGYAWCDMFVDWVFLIACGNKTDGEYTQCQVDVYGAGCSWSGKCYKDAGRFGKEPKVGAQIFFGTSDAWKHTGIVEKFDDECVYTIEGNTSNKVARRTYKRNDGYILGYGYPRFEEVEDIEETTIVEKKKSVDELAREVINGKWGNGSDRKNRLTQEGYSYVEVQNRVNEILKGKTKTVEQLAREVINGEWGNGSDRKNRLTSAGYDYYAVQKRVNEILR